MSSISLDIITFSEEGPSISPGNASHPAIGDSLIFCEYSKYRSISTEVNSSGSEIELTEGLVSSISRPFISTISELTILLIYLSFIIRSMSSGSIFRWLLGKEPKK